MRKLVEFLAGGDRKVGRDDRRGGQESWKGWRKRTRRREEQEASLTEALADKTKVVKFVVDKWVVNKGFGKVQSGEAAFIHARVVQGATVLRH